MFALCSQPIFPNLTVIITSFDFDKGSKSFDLVNMGFDIIDEINLSLFIDNNEYAQRFGQYYF